MELAHGGRGPGLQTLGSLAMAGRSLPRGLGLVGKEASGLTLTCPTVVSACLSSASSGGKSDACVAG